MIARVSLLGVLPFSLMLPSSSFELGVAIAIDHLINRVFWARMGGEDWVNCTKPRKRKYFPLKS